MKVYFTNRLYDQDGDLTDSGLFLHLEDSRTVIRIRDLIELTEFIESLQAVKNEVLESYGQ